MRHGKAALLSATVLATIASPLAAQTPAGFYVAAGIGANQPQSTSVQTRGGIQTGLGGNGGEVRFAPLPIGIIALGYGFGNGIRLELTAQLADEFEMLEESKTAHARLAEWNTRKEQWRRERAEGKTAAPLKPQQNDRPEVTGLVKG